MNSVVLIGRLTKDGDHHVTDGGMDIYKFTIAVDRPGSGEEKKTDFPRVTVFGKMAAACNKYLAKGKQVAVQGRLQTGSYVDKEGLKVYTTDVIADRVEFLTPASKEAAPDTDFAQLDEDVPF